MAPTFSIIISTWNRGRHIVPTIRSVLQQTFTDYELLIIGDGCTDETEVAVRPFLSERVKWRNLPERVGNQYGPNNAGIAMARGRYVSYLGHDDIWTPSHLATVARVLGENPDVSFGVAGCICYGPPGSGFHAVSGLFDRDEDKLTHFFPPSTFTHARDVVDRIGGWRAPMTVKAPVDCDFLLRAARAGFKFASTDEITVHKFATGSRYLAYAKPQSEEQTLIMDMMGSRAFDDLVVGVVARSREIGRYMGLRYPDFDSVPEGHHFSVLQAARGIVKPPLVRLESKAVLRQADDSRLIDWGKLQARGREVFRWSGANPRPRILLPFTDHRRTRLRFVIHATTDPTVLDKVRLSVNGVAVDCQFRRRDPTGQRAVLQCRAALKVDDYSIVELDLTGGLTLAELVRCTAGRSERLALGDVRLRACHAPRGVRSLATLFRQG